MSVLELQFAAGETSLSVRKFTVHEAVSELFTITIIARSTSPSIDLESIVGQPASFRVLARNAPRNASKQLAPDGEPYRSKQTPSIFLWPGQIFAIDRHPHPEVTADTRLLVTEFRAEGTPEGEWTMSKRFANQTEFRSVVDPPASD